MTSIISGCWGVGVADGVGVSVGNEVAVAVGVAVAVAVAVGMEVSVGAGVAEATGCSVGTNDGTTATPDCNGLVSAGWFNSPAPSLQAFRISRPKNRKIHGVDRLL